MAKLTKKLGRPTFVLPEAPARLVGPAIAIVDVSLEPTVTVESFSARTASELCGKEEQVKRSYSLSENGQDAGVSLLTGTATAHRATLSASKTYHLQRDFTFEAKVFAELKNAQAIVLVYDGLNPLPPTYCYLKPYYLDNNITYFEQLRQGL